jgi:hypothetical protein
MTDTGPTPQYQPPTEWPGQPAAAASPVPPPPSYSPAAQTGWTPPAAGPSAPYQPAAAAFAQPSPARSTFWGTWLRVVAWIMFALVALTPIVMLMISLSSSRGYLAPYGIVVFALIEILAIIVGLTIAAGAMLLVNWAEDTAAIRAKLYSRP